MPWRLKVIAEPRTVEDFDRLRPGDCWIDEASDPRYLALMVAPAHAGKRAWMVALPGLAPFPIYSAATRDNTAWTVTGEPPDVTVAPSIDCNGVYHGYIRDGVITDDLEHRVYDDRGRIVRTGRPPG